MATLSNNNITLLQSRNIIFWLVAIVFLTLYNLTPSLNSYDTQYYILAGEHFWNGHIDCLRTPVYPLLLKCCQEIFGTNGMANAITVLQSIVYIVSLVSLKRIAEQTIKNSSLSFVLLLFYVICIAPGWCNELTTESLSISGCVILANLVLSFLFRPKTKTNILIHIILVFLVFLRPTFIIFFAILPAIWIYQTFKSPNKGHYVSATVLTIICILCSGSYTLMYKNQYGTANSTATFVFNKIYDAHRGGYWNPENVKNPECRKWIDLIDANYCGNYDIVYNTITQHPESMVLIDEGCNDIISAHKAEHQKYRAGLLVSSFDKRFLAAVNTHTKLSSVLFVSSLFLSFPLSLFYLIVSIAVIYLLFYILKKRSIPIVYFFIVATIAAQTIGVILTTSDAHERVLLPIYPLFIILIGIIIDKLVAFPNNSSI